MFNDIHKHALFAAVFFAMASALVPADSRAALGTARSVAVSYGDLNLDTPAGITLLYARMRAAARDVCGPRDWQSLAAVAWKACYRDALTDAVLAIDSEALSELHRRSSAQPTDR